MKNQFSQDSESSILYIVPTPIGNINDITIRSVNVLKNVDLILAEDTRRTSILLKFFSIYTKLESLHLYNEKKKVKIFTKFNKRKKIALVSDAGTPTINDPGSFLIKFCREIGIKVIPLPGPCSIITALSASGILSDHFFYGGFLPKKRNARLQFLKKFEKENFTLIFCESKYRLLNSLMDMSLIFGISRYMVLARELTKVWESILRAKIGEIISWVKEGEIRQLGEIILLIEGYKIQRKKFYVSEKIELMFLSFMKERMSFKTSIMLLSSIFCIKKSVLYRHFLSYVRNKKFNL